VRHEPIGEGGFGYDPVFFDPETGKSFAQLTNNEKNTHSHRGRALISLKQKLEEQGLIGHT
jgi:XTP/dITP diphosphohydrolase